MKICAITKTNPPHKVPSKTLIACIFIYSLLQAVCGRPVTNRNDSAVLTSSHLCFLFSYWESVTTTMPWLCMVGEGILSKEGLSLWLRISSYFLTADGFNAYISCQFMVTSSLDQWHSKFFLYSSYTNPITVNFSPKKITNDKCKNFTLPIVKKQLTIMNQTNSYNISNCS